MNIKQETIDKFMSYVSPEALTGCWIWTGGVHRQGYGMFNGSGIKRTITAHRFSAMIHGLDMSGPVLRHKCHNTICCNPDHLETGTHKDNTQDMIKAGRSKLGGGKHIINIDGIEYSSVTDAARAIGFSRSSFYDRYINHRYGDQRANKVLPKNVIVTIKK